MASHIEKLCLEKNIKLTENRKIIAKTKYYGIWLVFF
jgi:hypothetical protein